MSNLDYLALAIVIAVLLLFALELGAALRRWIK